MQYQEFAATEEIDFYRFLHDRSKIKPLSQFLRKNIRTKVSPTKEVVLQKSKSVSIEDKRSFSADIKYQDKEEDKIHEWLASFDEDIISRKKKVVTEGSVETKNGMDKEQSQSNDNIQKTDEDIQDKDVGLKKRKPSLWRILEDTAQTMANHEHRLSGLDILDTKREFVSHETSDNNTLIKDTEGPSVLISKELHRSCECVQTSIETSVIGNRDSPTKRTGQRKISDFFQRTS